MFDLLVVIIYWLSLFFVLWDMSWEVDLWFILNIKVCLFDIYGMMLISVVGDILL